MSVEPHVSVCIPVYNGAAFVGEAIASVLSQTHPALDLVLVDNASTDGTAEVLAGFADPRLRVVRNPELVPAAENWNIALGHCRGPYVKLLCADDLLHPDCLRRQVAALEQAGPRAVLAASRRRVVDAAGRAVLHGRGLDGLAGVVPGDDALRACVRAGTNLLGEPAAVLLRRSALDQAGGFDGRYAYMIDVELWLRVLRAGDLVALPADLAAFRVHPGSWSGALAATQAEQAAAFLREVAAGSAAVSDDDLAAGLRSARRAARARQVVYRLLDQRPGSAALRVLARRRPGQPRWPAGPGGTMGSGPRAAGAPSKSKDTTCR